MPRLVTFSLNDGSSFVGEVDDVTQSPRTMRGGVPQEGLVEASNKTLELALESVKLAAQTVVDRFRTLAKPPEELTLELGIRLSAETGAVIAKASTDASFTITMKWNRSSTVGE
jgi:hypothetical protein